MRRDVAALLVGAVALVVVFEILPIDKAVQDLFFDSRSAAFVWQHEAAVEQWLHRRLKSALFVIPAIAGIGALGFRLLARRIRAGAPAAARRAAGLSRRWAFILVAMLAAPLAVSVAKQLSNRPCPWDVIGFGGDLPQRGLFDRAPDGQPPLACFPAGHASGGYALLAFALAGGVPGTRSRWLGARAFVAYALLLGSAMGLVRMAQGAHFLSHLLWSAWLVCAVQLAIARLMQPWEGKKRRPHGGHEGAKAGSDSMVVAQRTERRASFKSSSSCCSRSDGQGPAYAPVCRMVVPELQFPILRE